MTEPNLTEVQPGELLAGKYRIERILGRGGMGVVVSAIHEALDERVALKFLLPDALESREAVERFLREARAAVKIRSEHVARVTDVGTLASGSPYMVMEYLDGVDLARYVENTGPLPVQEAVEYVLQACEALAEAHALGIVHRDLKPANLFRTVRPDGTPAIKLLDFGISKITAPDASITRTSSMMGSPLYMAPEQMTSAKNVDARADVWAIGIILHELLAGEVPFGGETIPELCAKILTEPPRPIRALRAEVSPELERVILRCLNKDREQRYRSVAELAVELRPFAPERALLSIERVSRVLGVSRVAAEPLAAPAQTSAETDTQAAWGETATPAPPLERPRRGLLLAGAAAVVLGGVAAVLLLTPSDDGAVAGPAAAATAEPTPRVDSAGAQPPAAEPPPPATPAAAEKDVPSSSAPSADPPGTTDEQAPPGKTTTPPAPQSPGAPGKATGAGSALKPPPKTSGAPAAPSTAAPSSAAPSSAEPRPALSAPPPAPAARPAPTSKPHTDLYLERK
jgi:serine/threonine-protein kinase